MTKELLMHWWRYYGKVIYTLEELEKFSALIDKYGVEKISELVVASYVTSDGSPTTLLMSIRKNCVEKLLDTLPDISAFSENARKIHDDLKEHLENEFETSYIDSGIATTIIEKIEKIMESALLPPKRYRRRMSFKNIVKVRFLSCTFYLDLRVLQKHTSDIDYIFRHIKTGQGCPYDLARLKDDFIWAEGTDLLLVEDLMLIGLATGHIRYLKNVYFKNSTEPRIICN